MRKYISAAFLKEAARKYKLVVAFIGLGLLATTGVVFATTFNDDVHVSGDLFVNGGRFDLGNGTATTSIYSSNGHLGIGTENPWGNFEVGLGSVGSIRGAAVYDVGAGENITYFQLIGSSTDARVDLSIPGSAYGDVGWTFRADATDSNLKIQEGTRNPMTINWGDAKIGFSSTTPWGQFSVTQYNPGYPSLVIANTTNDVEFIVDDNGDVGIGEITPGSKLSVSGGATIGASYDTTAAPTNGLVVEGNVGIGTTSPQWKLGVNGNIGIGSDAGLNIESFSQPTIIANTTHSLGLIDSIISTAPASLNTGDGYVSSLFKAHFPNGTGYAFSVLKGSSRTAAANVQSYITDAGAAFFNGNVGIGTTNPATKLDVNGLVRVYQTATTTCSSSVEGSLFYNSSNKHFWGCDGTNWNRLDY